MPDTKEDVIVITGAGGGMGTHLVSYLLAQGYRNLALVYRNRHDELAKVVTDAGLERERHLFKAELSNEEQIAALRGAIEERLGPVTALINLAGGSTNGLSWKLSRADFSKVLDDNLIATFLCCREFIPGMRERGRGRIVNISSVVASTGVAGASHYCAAKAAIIGFTKALSLELAAKGVTANVVSLGYFQYGLIDHLNADLQSAVKDRIPLKRFGSAAELGGALEFLISDQGAYTTGQNIHINGGLFS